MSHKTAKTVTN